MVRWPIRIKLMVGLSVVVGMMLILMGGSILGLNSFHASNLTQTDQLVELGASVDLIDSVFRLHAPRDRTPQETEDLRARVGEARQALLTYFRVLKQNTVRGNRANSGFDELGLAFCIDDDLAKILKELDPESQEAVPVLPGTSYFVNQHPEKLPQIEPARDLKTRIERLNHAVMLLPKELFGDFYQVLVMSKGQYQTSRIIVWTSALTVLAMLCGLMLLFQRWVLYPVRLLQRGVRRVARGSFDYKIELDTGDEMQDLAEAFNDMTAKISLTYADLEQQVQERSRQLVRSERLAGVGFLAAGVAHEINNPLASIAFCSEALENRLGGLLAGSENPEHGVVSNYLKMIQEEAFRCKSITEKLLDFSRCNDIKRERADLAGLIQGVVDMIRHIGKYRGKAIHLPAQASRDGPCRQPGDQAGRAQPGGQCAGLDGDRRDLANRRAVQPRHGRDDLQRQRLRHVGRGARKHLRAFFHQAEGGERDRTGALDHAPNCQPASRRNHGLERRRGQRRNLQGAAANPSLRDRRGRAIQRQGQRQRQRRLTRLGEARGRGRRGWGSCGLIDQMR